MSQQLTDAELVARAYKLLNTSDIKSKLPQGYTLVMLWRASKAAVDAGIELLENMASASKARLTGLQEP